jgi:hypothetical protein
MANMEDSGLLQKIKDAFPSSPIPEVSLRQAVLADQTLARCVSEEEWANERHKDGSTPWTMLNDEALCECSEGLAHLDEESFVYYLGAFLCFAIKHANARIVDREGEFLCNIVTSLTNRSNYNLGRLKALNDAQISCVISVLELLSKTSETHGADSLKALDRYWLTPEAHRKTVVYVT